MIVRDHMTPDPVTVEAHASVHHVRDIIDQHGFHQLPVVDDENHLLGIVTDRDLRSVIGRDDHNDLDHIRVSRIMTSRPMTIQETDPIEHAILLHRRHRFGAFPVLAHRKLVGILSKFDLIRALHDLMGLDQLGSSLTVAIPKGIPDVINSLQHTTADDDILSIVAGRMQPDSKRSILYIRSAKGTGKLKKRLRTAGAILCES